MRAPRFWDLPAPTPAARLLQPLGAVYGAITARRMARTGASTTARVICVGNLTAGGAGKTPVALALAAKLSDQRPVFLSRGHGGRLAGPVLVDPARHGSAEVGDEPLLLARAAQTVVARNRLAGARLCETLRPGLIIMDDGLQNPSLAKDLRLAVVDAATGAGNGLCLPAGPLRAPIAAQLPHVDALIVMGEGPAAASIVAEARRHGLPVLQARLEPVAATLVPLSGRRLMAFAGIGRPAKFFATLLEARLDLGATRAFGDHHTLSEAEAAELLADAARQRAVLVTTAKDQARLAGAPQGSARAVLLASARVVEVEAVFADDTALKDLLSRLAR